MYYTYSSLDRLGFADEPSQPGGRRDDFARDDVVFRDAMHEDIAACTSREIMDDVDGAVLCLLAVRIGDIVIDRIQRQRVGPRLAIVFRQPSGHFRTFGIAVVVDEQEVAGLEAADEEARIRPFDV